jgi:hypothetical protein
MVLKKLLFLLVMLFLTVSLSGQTVKVKKEKSTVRGESMDGYSVELEGSLAEVNTAFLRFLKTMGKAKQSEFFVLNEPNVNGLVYNQPIFGITNQKEKSTTAWIGFNTSTWQKDDADKLQKELEKVMKDFGVKFYRDKIQVQIDESIRATQQRLLNENKSLSTKLEDNKREKTQLEKAVENNKLEHANLLRRLEQNKKAQDSVSVAADQIRKTVEVHKEKQRKVN